MTMEEKEAEFEASKKPVPYTKKVGTIIAAVQATVIEELVDIPETKIPHPSNKFHVEARACNQFIEKVKDDKIYSATMVICYKGSVPLDEYLKTDTYVALYHICTWTECVFQDASVDYNVHLRDFDDEHIFNQLQLLLQADEDDPNIIFKSKETAWARHLDKKHTLMGTFIKNNLYLGMDIDWTYLACEICARSHWNLLCRYILTQIFAAVDGNLSIVAITILSAKRADSTAMVRKKDCAKLLGLFEEEPWNLFYASILIHSVFCENAAMVPWLYKFNSYLHEQGIKRVRSNLFYNASEVADAYHSDKSIADMCMHLGLTLENIDEWQGIIRNSISWINDDNQLNKTVWKIRRNAMSYLRSVKLNCFSSDQFTGDTTELDDHVADLMFTFVMKAFQTRAQGNNYCTSYFLNSIQFMNLGLQIDIQKLERPPTQAHLNGLRALVIYYRNERNIRKANKVPKHVTTDLKDLIADNLYPVNANDVLPGMHYTEDYLEFGRLKDVADFSACYALMSKHEPMVTFGGLVDMLANNLLPISMRSSSAIKKLTKSLLPFRNELAVMQFAVHGFHITDKIPFHLTELEYTPIRSMLISNPASRSWGQAMRSSTEPSNAIKMGMCISHQIENDPILLRIFYHYSQSRIGHDIETTEMYAKLIFSNVWLPFPKKKFTDILDIVDKAIRSPDLPLPENKVMKAGIRIQFMVTQLSEMFPTITQFRNMVDNLDKGYGGNETEDRLLMNLKNMVKHCGKDWPTIVELAERRIESQYSCYLVKNAVSNSMIDRKKKLSGKQLKEKVAAVCEKNQFLHSAAMLGTINLHVLVQHFFPEMLRQFGYDKIYHEIRNTDASNTLSTKWIRTRLSGVPVTSDSCGKPGSEINCMLKALTYPPKDADATIWFINLLSGFCAHVSTHNNRNRVELDVHDLLLGTFKRMLPGNHWFVRDLFVLTTKTVIETSQFRIPIAHPFTYGAEVKEYYYKAIAIRKYFKPAFDDLIQNKTLHSHVKSSYAITDVRKMRHACMCLEYFTSPCLWIPAMTNKDVVLNQKPYTLPKDLFEQVFLRINSSFNTTAGVPKMISFQLRNYVDEPSHENKRKLISDDKSTSLSLEPWMTSQKKEIQMMNTFATIGLPIRYSPQTIGYLYDYLKTGDEDKLLVPAESKLEYYPFSCLHSLGNDFTTDEWVQYNASFAIIIRKFCNSTVFEQSCREFMRLKKRNEIRPLVTVTLFKTTNMLLPEHVPANMLIEAMAVPLKHIYQFYKEKHWMHFSNSVFSWMNAEAREDASLLQILHAYVDKEHMKLFNIVTINLKAQSEDGTSLDITHSKKLVIKMFPHLETLIDKEPSFFPTRVVLAAFWYLAKKTNIKPKHVGDDLPGHEGRLYQNLAKNYLTDTELFVAPNPYYQTKNPVHYFQLNKNANPDEVQRYLIKTYQLGQRWPRSTYVRQMFSVFRRHFTSQDNAAFENYVHEFCESIDIKLEHVPKAGLIHCFSAIYWIHCLDAELITTACVVDVLCLLNYTVPYAINLANSDSMRLTNRNAVQNETRDFLKKCSSLVQKNHYKPPVYRSKDEEKPPSLSFRNDVDELCGVSKLFVTGSPQPYVAEFLKQCTVMGEETSIETFARLNPETPVPEPVWTFAVKAIANRWIFKYPLTVQNIKFDLFSKHMVILWAVVLTLTDGLTNTQVLLPKTNCPTSFFVKAFARSVFVTIFGDWFFCEIAVLNLLLELMHLYSTKLDFVYAWIKYHIKDPKNGYDTNMPARARTGNHGTDLWICDSSIYLQKALIPRILSEIDKVDSETLYLALGGCTASSLINSPQLALWITRFNWSDHNAYEAINALTAIKKTTIACFGDNLRFINTKHMCELFNKAFAHRMFCKIENFKDCVLRLTEQIITMLACSSIRFLDSKPAFLNNVYGAPDAPKPGDKAAILSSLKEKHRILSEDECPYASWQSMEKLCQKMYPKTCAHYMYAYRTTYENTTIQESESISQSYIYSLLLMFNFYGKDQITINSAYPYIEIGKLKQLIASRKKITKTSKMVSKVKPVSIKRIKAVPQPLRLRKQDPKVKIFVPVDKVRESMVQAAHQTNRMHNNRFQTFEIKCKRKALIYHNEWYTWRTFARKCVIDLGETDYSEVAYGLFSATNLVNDNSAAIMSSVQNPENQKNKCYVQKDRFVGSFQTTYGIFDGLQKHNAEKYYNPSDVLPPVPVKCIPDRVCVQEIYESSNVLLDRFLKRMEIAPRHTTLRRFRDYSKPEHLNAAILDNARLDLLFSEMGEWCDWFNLFGQHYTYEACRINSREWFIEHYIPETSYGDKKPFAEIMDGLCAGMITRNLELGDKRLFEYIIYTIFAGPDLLINHNYARIVPSAPHVYEQPLKSSLQTKLDVLSYEPIYPTFTRALTVFMSLDMVRMDIYPALNDGKTVRYGLDIDVLNVLQNSLARYRFRSSDNRMWQFLFNNSVFVLSGTSRPNIFEDPATVIMTSFVTDPPKTTAHLITQYLKSDMTTESIAFVKSVSKYFIDFVRATKKEYLRTGTHMEDIGNFPQKMVLYPQTCVSKADHLYQLKPVLEKYLGTLSDSIFNHLAAVIKQNSSIYDIYARLFSLCLQPYSRYYFDYNDFTCFMNVTNMRFTITKKPIYWNQFLLPDKFTPGTIYKKFEPQRKVITSPPRTKASSSRRWRRKSKSTESKSDDSDEESSVDQLEIDSFDHIYESDYDTSTVSEQIYSESVVSSSEFDSDSSTIPTMVQKEQMHSNVATFRVKTKYLTANIRKQVTAQDFYYEQIPYPELNVHNVINTVCVLPSFTGHLHTMVRRNVVLAHNTNASPADQDDKFGIYLRKGLHKYYWFVKKFTEHEKHVFSNLNHESLNAFFLPRNVQAFYIFQIFTKRWFKNQYVPKKDDWVHRFLRPIGTLPINRLGLSLACAAAMSIALQIYLEEENIYLNMIVPFMAFYLNSNPDTAEMFTIHQHQRVCMLAIPRFMQYFYEMTLKEIDEMTGMGFSKYANEKIHGHDIDILTAIYKDNAYHNHFESEKEKQYVTAKRCVPWIALNARIADAAFAMNIKLGKEWHMKAMITMALNVDVDLFWSHPVDMIPFQHDVPSLQFEYKRHQFQSLPHKFDGKSVLTDDVELVTNAHIIWSNFKSYCSDFKNQLKQYVKLDAINDLLVKDSAPVIDSYNRIQHLSITLIQLLYAELEKKLTDNVKNIITTALELLLDKRNQTYNSFHQLLIVKNWQPSKAQIFYMVEKNVDTLKTLSEVTNVHSLQEYKQQNELEVARFKNTKSFRNSDARSYWMKKKIDLDKFMKKRVRLVGNNTEIKRLLNRVHAMHLDLYSMNMSKQRLRNLLSRITMYVIDCAYVYHCMHHLYVNAPVFDQTYLETCMKDVLSRKIQFEDAAANIGGLLGRDTSEITRLQVEDMIGQKHKFLIKNEKEQFLDLAGTEYTKINEEARSRYLRRKKYRQRRARLAARKNEETEQKKEPVRRRVYVQKKNRTYKFENQIQAMEMVNGVMVRKKFGSLRAHLKYIQDLGGYVPSKKKPRSRAEVRLKEKREREKRYQKQREEMGELFIDEHKEKPRKPKEKKPEKLFENFRSSKHKIGRTVPTNRDGFFTPAEMAANAAAAAAAAAPVVEQKNDKPRIHVFEPAAVPTSKDIDMSTRVSRIFQNQQTKNAYRANTSAFGAQLNTIVEDENNGSVTTINADYMSSE